MNISDLTRRSFVAGALSAPFVSAQASKAIAQISIGSGTLTTVSDGHLTLPGQFLLGDAPSQEALTTLKSMDISTETLTPECNLALWRDNTHKVLFDAGAGVDFMASAGRLVDNLAAVGETPEDITHVVFTHAHPDHIWGLLDDFDDPLFANATHMMGRSEWAYWWDPQTVHTIGEARAAFAVGAKRRMEAIEDSAVLFDDGDEILPGLSALATYGHTPGHMAFELRSGGTSAVIVGDAIVNHHLALRLPDWRSGSDHDPDAGAVSRKRLLERLTREDLSVVGFHLPQGGLGRIDRLGDAYTFVPT